ncbi:MAG: hypothetical protein Q8S32_01430 [Burkholderiaceae bacterium]|jgi:hypothetical protein|nr:hypothetical protein [Burkholderiaceae bacterium]MDP3422404.1 hypothetical protein [Burkholderiaceae bacterium]MDZ4160438.1 hypothetical protein [Burkholderiales bacterium]
MNFTFQQEPSIDSGRYVVSPATCENQEGAFQASIAIQSGRGSSSHHRVLRFRPTFASREGARLYAITQGHCWLQARHAA